MSKQTTRVIVHHTRPAANPVQHDRQAGEHRGLRPVASGCAAGVGGLLSASLVRSAPPRGRHQTLARILATAEMLERWLRSDLQLHPHRRWQR